MHDAEARANARSLTHYFDTDPGGYLRPWRWLPVQRHFKGPGMLLISEVEEMRQADVLPDWSADEDESNLLHQRYHFMRWQRSNPALDLTKLHSIQQIGGGYGATAIVAARLGFRGQYHIHDFCEFEYLQDRHLASRDLPFKVRHRILKRPALLISCPGLSEIPIVERERIMARCQPRNYLITFDGASDPWFAQWAQAHVGQGGPVWHLHPGPIGATVSYMVSHRRQP